MSNFLDDLHEKSQSTVKRKTIILPQSGKRVVVRSLMSGPMLRVNAAPEDLRGLALFAFAVEDPENPGKPVANWNAQEDRDKIAGLHIDDLTAVTEAWNEVQGITVGDVEKNSPGTESSSTSSPSGTELSLAS